MIVFGFFLFLFGYGMLMWVLGYYQGNNVKKDQPK